MASQAADSPHLEEVARPPNQKRASRACDLCRRTRSKCERSLSDTNRCKVCLSANSDCTYNDQIHKRGPPKGYITAIEQRWQQVESLLGVIISSRDPRAQSLVSSLKADELAKTVLERVDRGPYGPSGRLQQPSIATKDDFFASVLKSAGGQVTEALHENRKSRVSREYVSSYEEKLALSAPTSRWQDRLISLMSDPNSLASASDAADRFPSAAASITRDTSGAPLAQRRRLGEMSTSSSQPDWSAMLTMDGSLDDSECVSSDGASEALVQLSLKDNDQIQYLGKASGLHLLTHSGREDRHNEGGLWRMPLTNLLSAQAQTDDSSIERATRTDMPSLANQNRLIKLYFTYFHPYFPVIHKKQFFSAYSQSGAVGDEAQGKTAVSPLLLLCIFSIAVRFDGNLDSPTARSAHNTGSEYADRARDVLGNILHHSRPATCQALLILGYHAFGMGSAEQGWIYIGMAIRMAYDLGLHRNADKWKRDGAQILSAETKQARQQIWWACCLADRYASSSLGRPCTILENEYDTPLPMVDDIEDHELWSPPHPDFVHLYRPCPGLISSTFRAASSLSEIMGSIISVVQCIRHGSASYSDTQITGLEVRLEEWLTDLDGRLCYHLISDGPPPPPPHVLTLHMQYWMAILLIHRPSIPNWKIFCPIERDAAPVGMRAFVLSQSAATHISAIATSFRTTFGLSSSPPTLPFYLFSAGVVHVMKLAVEPSDPEGTLGLQLCLGALQEMETLWPCARRARGLLEDCKLRCNAQAVVDDPSTAPELALGTDGFCSIAGQSGDVVGVQDLHWHLVAKLLCLNIPGHS